MDNYFKISYQYNKLFKSLEKNDFYSFYKYLNRYSLTTYYYRSYYDLRDRFLFKNINKNKNIVSKLNSITEIKLLKLLDTLTILNYYTYVSNDSFISFCNKTFFNYNYIYFLDIRKYFKLIDYMLLDIKKLDKDMYYKALVVVYNHIYYNYTNKKHKHLKNLSIIKNYSKNWLDKYKNDFIYLIENIYIPTNIEEYSRFASGHMHDILPINATTIKKLNTIYNDWYKKG